ncbi:MAG: hypothetical protein J3R72DRAFT_428838 [Linnemannia gamsii]|nr:MAG: hypothetical protein J3R72DRAFT_428838 [Linnemannia gamsii]
MTRPSSLTNIPQELLGLLVSNLSGSDLVNCALVCKSWNQLFTHFIWRHVRRKTWNLDEDLWDDIFLQSCEAGALKTNGHFIHTLDINDLETFLEHAPLTLPNLTSAEFVDLDDGDDMIADFIERCTGGLKELVINSNFNDLGVSFGSGSSDALLKHASTLEIIRMESAPCFESQDIQQLLCSAPNLKEFYLFGLERRPENVDGCLDAQDIVESEWVCTELEVFGCEIGNIPRHDITHDIAGRPSKEFIRDGSRQESIELHRGVYAQLGRLTKLRELTLGIALSPDLDDDMWEHERLYDCLAMTLESGLDLMKGLSELEVVRLDAMEVYIDRDEERAWVKKQWPKVKGISLN